MFTTQALYTIGQVSQQFGMSRSRLAYLVEAGYVTQPSASVPGRKLFSSADTIKLREALVRIGEIVPHVGSTGPTQHTSEIA